MIGDTKTYGLTIPPEYHDVLFVGKKNRAGEIIDFKHSPTYIKSGISLEEYRRLIFSSHINAKDLPYIYTNPRPFIVVRPTAIDQQQRVESLLGEVGLEYEDVTQIDNFMRLADSVYILDDKMDFTWKWRAIMLGLHQTVLQDQNRALVYFFDETFLDSESEYQRLVDARSIIRREIGSIPYLFFYEDALEFGMDLHHLHTPDFDTLDVEYNALMHAIYKTSLFSET